VLQARVLPQCAVLPSKVWKVMVLLLLDLEVSLKSRMPSGRSEPLMLPVYSAFETLLRPFTNEPLVKSSKAAFAGKTLIPNTAKASSTLRIINPHEIQFDGAIYQMHQLSVSTSATEDDVNVNLYSQTQGIW
jgi:hypothetical protein